MKILITGGLGFIGLNLASRLLNLGHEVILLDNLSPQIHGDIPNITVPEGAVVHRLDIRQLVDRYEIIDGCDVVYHLASETGTAQSMYRISDYVSANVLGTTALLEAIAKCSNRPKQIILASSRSIYGEGAYESVISPGNIVQPMPRTMEQLQNGEWELMGSDGQALHCIPTPEALSYAPGSVYAASKAAQELLLNSVSASLGYRLSVFRFQNVYGEGQSLQNPYTGIISIFFNRARQGLEIPIYEDGLASRDFVHISDIVSALISSLTADIPPAYPMNIGAGAATSITELAQELIRISGFKTNIKVTGQYRMGDIRHCYADLTRAKAVLGYLPKISLNEGLSRFCDWAAQQPSHKDKLNEATEELRKKGLTN